MAPTEHAFNGYPPAASSPEELGAAPATDKIEDSHDNDLLAHIRWTRVCHESAAYGLLSAGGMAKMPTTSALLAPHARRLGPVLRVSVWDLDFAFAAAQEA